MIASRTHAGARNFHFAVVAQLSGGLSPVGSGGETPVRGVCDKVFQKPKQCADIVCIFLTAETIKIWNFRTIHFLIFDQQSYV